MPKTSKNRASFIPAILVSLAVVSTPLLALTEPIRGDQVAVIFPPGWDESDVLLASAAAGTSIVRFGALPSIGIIEITDNADLGELRRQGALLFLHPQALGGCLLLPTAFASNSDAEDPASSSQWSAT